MLPDIESLLTTPFPASLGPERRTGVLGEKELSGKVDELLGGTNLSENNQQLIRALLLLWHDHLEPAHRIAQEVHNSDGSFVHGIMHRREPDYANAGYWFRRVGRHDTFPELVKRISPILESKKNKTLQAQLLPRGAWDALAFIDACEHAQTDTERALLEDIQAVETRVLLEHFSR